MTDTTNIITPEQVGALGAIQLRIGEANAAKGFHDRGEFLRHSLATAEVHGDAFGLDLEFWRETLNDYIANRLLLVVSEVVEAHDEIRTGKSVYDEYYSGGVEYDYTDPAFTRDLEPHEYVDANGAPRKPEGFLSEVVDAGIRLHDLAEEFKLPAPEKTAEKLAYNATRPHKHGKKF